MTAPEPFKSAAAQRKLRGGWLVGGGLWMVAAWCGQAVAAPLDGLLTAAPDTGASTFSLALATDHMNSSLDIFKVRSNDASLESANTGDYSGQHVTAIWQAAPDVWLSGSWWNRAVTSAADTYRYNSWQVSGQYRFLQARDAWPAMAVRLSSWGNEASATETTSPVRVPGAILNTVKITQPADQQVQLDLVGSWQLTPASELSLFASGGVSRLSYGGLSATTTQNGCNYQLQFTGNSIYGSLAQPCSGSSGVIEQFFDSSGDYGVDVAKEIAWRGKFIQLGVNGNWRNGPWKLAAGYHVNVISRSDVDQILRARNKTPYTSNKALVLQANYRFNNTFSTFAQAQYNTNLFFNDLPVTYNSSTSVRFSRSYSLYTVGVRADF